MLKISTSLNFAKRSLSIPSTKVYPSQVTLVEVGPRDGLQNEKQIIESDKKIEFVNLLSQTGLKRIEVTSHVSPKWIPQLADALLVMNGIKRNPSIRYSSLTPNLKGLEKALECKSQEVAVFVAASETFTKKNINSTIAESLKAMESVSKEASKHKIPVRGYVSCVVGCPYEGKIKPSQVCSAVEKLLEQGCYEVSLGDTIGVGTPHTINALLKELRPVVGGNMNFLAIHCHDTYGMALVNIIQALEHGINVIDSAVAGLGGCPYAKGASGNVATEDVLWMLDSMGVKTGVDMQKILNASEFILKVLNRQSLSKVNLALLSQRQKVT